MGLLTRPFNELHKRLVFLANTRGIIPNPVTATRILEYSPDIDNDTHTLYTVANGKVLFIASCWVAVRNDSGTQAGAILKWVNASDVLQRELLSPYCRASSQETSGLSFVLGLEIPAQHKVQLASAVATCYAKGGIYGWLEDV